MTMTKSELKVIKFQLEILTDFKTEVDDLSLSIKQIIDNGVSWTEGRNTQMKYHPMNQYLTMETSKCIRNCLSIAQERQHLSQSVPDGEESDLSAIAFKESKDNQVLMEKLEDVIKLSKTNSKKINKIEQKNVNLQKRITDCESKNETDAKDIKAELHRASQFMRELQAQMDTFRIETSQNGRALKKLCAEISESENEVARAHTLLETLSQTTQDKMGEQRALVKKIEEDVRHNFKANESRISDHENKLKEAHQLIVGLKTESEALSTTVSGVEENLDELSDTVHQFKTEITDQHSLLTTRYDGLETKLNSTSDEIQAITHKIQSMNQVTAFCSAAYNGTEIDLLANEMLTCFSYVRNNVGNGYDVTTGIFTAPSDGLYLFCLFIYNLNETDIYLKIVSEDLNNIERIRSYVYCNKSKGSHGSCAAPLDLKKNEQVFLRTHYPHVKLKLDYRSQFVGVLIKEM